MAVSVQESEVRAALKGGERLRRVFVVERDTGKGPEYLAYLLPSWRPDVALLSTWRARSEKPYRDLGRLFRVLRDDFEFGGPITVYPQGDAALRRLLGEAPAELAA